MKQSRLASLAETAVSTVLGFVLAVLAQTLIFPLFGIHVLLSTNIYLVIVFTIISFFRNFFVRRLFNAAPWRRFKEEKVTKQNLLTDELKYVNDRIHPWLFNAPERCEGDLTQVRKEDGHVDLDLLIRRAKDGCVDCRQVFADYVHEYCGTLLGICYRMTSDDLSKTEHVIAKELQAKCDSKFWQTEFSTLADFRHINEMHIKTEYLFGALHAHHPDTVVKEI